MHGKLLDEARALRSLPSPAMAEALRRDAGISRRRLAKELGVHEITVWRWEQGATQPRGRCAVVYAEVLKALREVRER
jgi:DNA-binding transcriptional regulator YiaG